MSNRRGFTFVEMTMSVIVIALIAVAISGFSMAVSTHWKATNQSQVLQNTGERSQATIGAVIENAKTFGVVSDTTRQQLLIWYSDSFNGTSDGVAQLGEMAVLEYDPALKSIMVYRSNLNLTYDATSTANYVIQASDLTNGNVADYFKAQSWVLAGRPLLGPGTADAADSSMTQVTDATFTAFSGSAKSGVLTSVTISRDGSATTFQNLFGQRGAIAPAAAPNGSVTVASIVAPPAVTVSVTASISAASVSASLTASTSTNNGNGSLKTTAAATLK